MKKFIILLLLISLFSGCTHPQRTQESNLNTIVPTKNAQEKDINYFFNVSKEWDESDYKKTFGQDLYYFNAPILSPYKYTYICEENDMTIEEIANELGVIMIEDLMRDYEGKTFIITEYKNLVAYVMNNAELIEWEERFEKLGKKVTLDKNQWLCTFSCDYKYSGIYSNIGEMPSDLEWMKTLETDGSGENHVFIIEKYSEDEYIMRGMPKTIMEEVEPND